MESISIRINCKLRIKDYYLLQANNVQVIDWSCLDEFGHTCTINAHIEHTDSIENLAIVTNCSVSTFKRKFKELFNTTPAKYRLENKLIKVAGLLKTSDKSISNIGYECGFESPEHLSRVFKKQYGIPPSQYRLSFLVK